MDAKKINLNLDLAVLGEKLKKVPSFLDRKRRWVIIIIALCFAGHVCYEYYNYIYNPIWSEEKRQAYINSKERDTIFNKVDFDKVLKEIEKRKIEYIDNSIKPQKDIFKLSQ